MSIDFPRAWEIATSVEREYHHNECSFNVSRGGVLCDCDVIHKHPEYTDKINFYGAGGIEMGARDEDARTVWKAMIAAAPCPEGVREGAPYDDPAFESLCREHEIWGTPAAAQCAVFWEAGKRVAEQKPAPDVAVLVEALEYAIETLDDCDMNLFHNVIEVGSAALAPYRKGGGK